MKFKTVYNCISTAADIPDNNGLMPCITLNTQTTIQPNILINKELEHVLIINEFANGLNIISNIYSSVKSIRPLKIFEIRYGNWSPKKCFKNYLVVELIYWSV